MTNFFKSLFFCKISKNMYFLSDELILEYSICKRLWVLKFFSSYRLLWYCLTTLLKWCTISHKLLRAERPNFTKGLKPTNHDQVPTANSITVILTNHLYKPDLDHSTDNNFSLDSHDDFRSGCRKSVITVKKQSFSRTTLTLTIKLHY